MNDQYLLDWETFEFYTQELHKQEEYNINLMRTIQTFIENNPSPKRYQRKRLLSRADQCYTTLSHLYKKQIDSVDSLIEHHKDDSTVPDEFKIEPHTLYALRNLTFTLIEQIKKENKQIKKLLS
jgi:hypothetical protein